MLITCQECDTRMSDTASSCPQCGWRRKTKKALRGKDLLLMFGGLLMIMVFFGAAIHYSMLQHTVRRYMSMAGGFAGIGMLGWGLIVNHLKHTR